MLFVFSSAILVFALSLSFVLIKPFSFNLSGVGSSCLSLLAWWQRYKEPKLSKSSQEASFQVHYGLEYSCTETVVFDKDRVD